jgi:hypothetical protein
MTIGIGAHGPRAGLAVFEALQAAEAVGKGAIGGFAAFAAIGEDGRLHRHQTQRGGTRTMFTEGETTGAAPPEAVATAIAAAVISSGPDRPEPLAQFLAADTGAGLVTGHRLPNGPAASGRPLNVETLALLASGRTPREAVDTVIDANPEADVGLIAIGAGGGVHGRNSARVERRPDLGAARVEDAAAGAAVAVLHNAIRPFPVLAGLVAAVALEVMAGAPEPSCHVTICTGTPVRLGPENAIRCDGDFVATEVQTSDPVLVRGRQVGAALYLGSRVYAPDGRSLGVTMFEPIVTVEDGVIVMMSGQTMIRMSVRA